MGRRTPVRYSSRRVGDPAVPVADASGAARDLGCVARSSSLDTIVQTAWQWHRSSRSSVLLAGNNSALRLAGHLPANGVGPYCVAGSGT